MDKVRATRAIQQAGLEGLPAAVFHGDRQGILSALESAPDDARFVLRAASSEEERNLPRLVNVEKDSAIAWVLKLPPMLSVIMQPYAELIFSAELAIGQNLILAEVIHGPWELDNLTEPTCLRLDVAGPPPRWTIEAPVPGCAVSSAQIPSDWEIAELASWVGREADRLRVLRTSLGFDYGLKVHYAKGYGMSPQNIRTSTLDLRLLVEKDEDRMKASVPAISDISASPPTGARAVVVRVAIARERSEEIEAFARRLVNAGVEVAYLESGLLSHLAICMREAGLLTRRSW